jgi:hypothetical protein
MATANADNEINGNSDLCASVKPVDKQKDKLASIEYDTFIDSGVCIC